MELKQTGGFAALYAGCAYIFGFSVLLLLLSPEQASEWSHAQRLEFLLENKTLLHIWNNVIYTVFGIVLIFLTLALDTRIPHTDIIRTKATKTLGFIWAALLIASGMIANVGMEKVSSLYASDPALAVTVWQMLGIIQDGLGGGVEVLGGLWVVLISVMALRTRTFSTALNIVGIIVGIAGCLTILPGLSDFGAIFGLGQILWFLCLSVAFFRDNEPL
ncbi:hypothetical protein OPS25_00700 [Alteromonas ponticola]|uniref:DUF4386 family protein n=1 Tax=Alteromonas aquimaris TaxID=2998417 RepID=A0ABT3P2N5_9ALTE|nr:hypothetical protein [Alteromonas aquimaris]MCW8107020.1 hypothetical protein [Alteromonas aquimaris]